MTLRHGAATLLRAVPLVLASACASPRDEAAPDLTRTTSTPPAIGSASPATTVDPLAGLPTEVSCGVNFRPDADTLDGSVDATVVAPRVDGPPGTPGGTATFPNLTFELYYGGDQYDGYSTSVVVYGDGAELLRVLYQLGGVSLDEVQFAGGHGFTGLHYVSHGGSLLQFWCWAA